MEDRLAGHRGHVDPEQPAPARVADARKCEARSIASGIK